MRDRMPTPEELDRLPQKALELVKKIKNTPGEIRPESEDKKPAPIPEQLRKVFDDAGSSKIKAENEKVLSAIDKFLEDRLLPRTYELTDGSSVEQGKKIRKVIKGSIPGYIDKKSKPGELFLLGSILLGRKISPENVEDDLRQAFAGKKILVIGDDIGGLSEIVILLGGEAYGIEYDERKVSIANSGKLAENGKPQTQVMHGDMLDLTDADSELLKKLNELGPFDVIFSDAVLNGGSGIEQAEEVYSRARRGITDLSFVGKILENTDQLLKDNGIHLDMSIDSTGSFLRHGEMPSQMKTNRSTFNNYGTDFYLQIGWHGTDHHQITRKGIMQKLKKANPEIVTIKFRP